MPVLIILLLTGPHGAREVPLPSAGLTACVKQGGAVGSAWVADHPGYTLLGWRCRIGRQDGAA